MIALLLTTLALQVGDAPPVEPRPVEEPAQDDDDDDDVRDDNDDNDDHDELRDEDDDDDDAPARPRPLPDADDDAPDDTFSPVFWGGGSGCLLGGVLPATGAAFGLGLFYGAGACGEVAGAIGGLSGALVAVPSLLLLGPCAAGGTTLGATIGAVLSAQDPLTAALWTLPGLGMGVAGGALATAGLLVTSTTDPDLQTIAVPLGTTLVILGSAAALGAGPLAVAGATLTQEPWDLVTNGQREDLRDGGIEARRPPTQRPPSARTTVAMAF